MYRHVFMLASNPTGEMIRPTPSTDAVDAEKNAYYCQLDGSSNFPDDVPAGAIPCEDSSDCVAAGCGSRGGADDPTHCWVRPHTCFALVYFALQLRIFFVLLTSSALTLLPPLSTATPRQGRCHRPVLVLGKRGPGVRIL
jgi:hypothetical protein